MKYLKRFSETLDESSSNESMTVEVWEDEDGITVFTEGDPQKDWLLGENPKLIRTIEGEDWTDCMIKHHELMGWEPYKPF